MDKVINMAIFRKAKLQCNCGLQGYFTNTTKHIIRTLATKSAFRDLWTVLLCHRLYKTDVL